MILINDTNTLIDILCDTLGTVAYPQNEKPYIVYEGDEEVIREYVAGYSIERFTIGVYLKGTNKADIINALSIIALKGYRYYGDVWLSIKAQPHIDITSEDGELRGMMKLLVYYRRG